ncbi:DUF5076 domain-containing protein [Ralstonia solanacearum]|nr:DUF5076 domain-containing protein [Ralstonia solanacearum]
MQVPDMNERPIPPAALRDEDAVEMLRVWIAEKKLHCSMKVGMYLEAMNISEEMAWGVILADATRHIANALEFGYSENRDVSIEKIKESYLKELAEATSDAAGDFV